MSYLSDEKLKRSRYLRRTALAALVLLALAAVLIPASWYIGCRTRANRVFREAKNTRLAMRYLTIQYQAEEKDIFDSTQADGFSAGTAAEICRLADAPGTLQLTAWDPHADVPLHFSYTNGSIEVIYACSPGTQQETWRVVCLVDMMKFTM